MRIYTVHIDPTSADDDQGVVLIREGFSWGAALFTVLWALWRGLWGWAAILLAAAVALDFAAAWLGLGAIGVAAIQITFMLLVGFHGNDWRRARLMRRGYLFAGVVSGRDMSAAERRFFDREAALAA